MFGSRILLNKIIKPIKACTRSHQVTVLGGATDVGQTLCLLLRGEPRITKLIIHDTQLQTSGVVLDLSHIPTNAAVVGYIGDDSMEQALLDSEIVIGAGGLTQKPGITPNLWLSTNTLFVKCLAKAVSRLEPMPFVGLVTEPINSLIPMAAEIIRYHGCFDSNKLFGITNIDAMRAQSLYAAQHKFDPRSVFVPVIGGHSEKTCLPLLSQADPPADYSDGDVQEFTTRFRKVEDSVLSAKRGFAPSLAIAYSAFLFTRSVLSVLDGNEAVVNAFISNNDFGTEYFSGVVNINEHGVKEMRRYTNVSTYECYLLESCIKKLRRDVLKGKKILEYV